ncbi:carbon-nitrogen hydrolase family protein [Aliikangiella sp. IMCC44653]
MKVALAQIAPVWLNREKTLHKVVASIQQAASQKAKLIVFGEALVPGYPFWIELTNGAKFNDPIQKKIHAEYANQAVQLERGDLSEVCLAAAEASIAVYLGIIERPSERGGHSLYCSMVYINNNGEIASVHRKLVPTYEERLSWSPGDGHGLVTHKLEEFTLGGLNCWENWMPLTRAALYAQGEDLHVSIWPGSQHNTFDLIPVIAKEARAYSLAVCSIMRPADCDSTLPELAALRESETPFLANGGSCLANPDGSWLIEPQVNCENIFYAQLEHDFVRRERQNFDPSGHYSRPDVTQLTVNRERQAVVKFK